MKEEFSRTALVLGQDAIEKLQNSHVIVFGVGGVGGYVVEALVRAGVGELSVVDNDTVSASNINRQIIALHSTIGRSKVDVICERALDINPNIKLHKHNCFFLPDTATQFNFTDYDFVVDCVDTVTAKLSIIENVVKVHTAAGNSLAAATPKPAAHTATARADLPLITCLGTGNKLNPMGFEVTTVEKTSVCPLAKVMRRELKARGIFGVKCVYSKEAPVDAVVEGPGGNVEACQKNSRHAPGSVSFVPAAAGLLIASEVIRCLIS